MLSLDASSRAQMRLAAELERSPRLPNRHRGRGPTSKGKGGKKSGREREGEREERGGKETGKGVTGKGKGQGERG